jgi:hypothetical protein
MHFFIIKICFFNFIIKEREKSIKYREREENNNNIKINRHISKKKRKYFGFKIIFNVPFYIHY